jgi:hypothetical protein
MLRKALLVGLLVGSGLGGTLAAVAAGPFFAPEPPTTAGEPFSAVAQTQSTTVFADGNRIVRTNTVHYFRDAQGRTRVERPALAMATAVAVKEGSSGGATGHVMPADSYSVINDPVNGERITLIPPMKMATVFKYPQGKAPGQLAPASLFDNMAPFGLLGLGMGVGADGRTTESSADTTSLGDKIVNGVLATGTRIVRVIPIGALGNEKPITSTLEEWKSAELGIPVQITETSSIGGRLTYNLQDVVRAEPDPSLFTVPAGYRTQDLMAPVAAASPATSTATFTAVKKP